MFNSTEIKIISLLRGLLSNKAAISLHHSSSAELLESLLLLKQKGIISIGKSLDKNDALKYVSLTDYGYNYPM